MYAGSGLGSDERDMMRNALLVATVCIAVLLGAPAAARAWANGPKGDGFGTHDWLLYRANEIARAQGHGWLEFTAAQPLTDDPDTQLHDTVNHVYDITDTPGYGSAPERVAKLFDRAVLQLRAGDRAGASRTVGLLSHYYTDINNPLHSDQSAAEERMHQRYEQKVNQYTDHADENAAWVTAKPFILVTDPAAFTREAAAEAAPSYTSLVTEYDARGFDTRVRDITRASLDRAANGLADLIGSVEVQAGRGGPGTAAAGKAPGPAPAGCPGPAMLAFGLVAGGAAAFTGGRTRRR
jgi:hypothetical protein